MDEFRAINYTAVRKISKKAAKQLRAKFARDAAVVGKRLQVRRERETASEGSQPRAEQGSTLALILAGVASGGWCFGACTCALRAPPLCRRFF